mmetsp:Transcript_101936/g.283652  ORF Transcript_101936/g.283652 Transcript_101936/m.283652 type:complete len:201 (+) Transcript_101936:845-1447(+)
MGRRLATVRRDQVNISRVTVLQALLPNIDHRVGDEGPRRRANHLGDELRVSVYQLGEDFRVRACTLNIVLCPSGALLETVTQQVIPHLDCGLHRSHVPYQAPVPVKAFHLHFCGRNDQIRARTTTPKLLHKLLGPSAPVWFYDETAFQVEEGLQESCEHAPILGVHAADVEACGGRAHSRHIASSNCSPHPLVWAPADHR